MGPIRRRSHGADALGPGTRIAMAANRRLVTTSVLVALASALAAVAWAERLGLDAWNLPRLRGQIASERRLQTDLQAELATLRRRIAHKESVVTDLTAGRMTLAEAAAAFQAADDERAAGRVRQRYPGCTDDERYSRTVFYWVANRLESDRAAAAALPRLRRQLDEEVVRARAAFYSRARVPPPAPGPR